MKYLKLLAFIFLFCLFGAVSSQYYYFDSGGNTYQQGCSGELNVRINSQGQNIKAGLFRLVLDPATTIYATGPTIAALRSFFVASNETFLNWSSDNSPSWKNGSNYTILQADRSNTETFYNGHSGLYATIKFKPQYFETEYLIQFGMEYFPGETYDTVLTKSGADLINSTMQNNNKTGTFPVLQEPCVADTNKPTISNFSIANNATKVKYDEGITLKLLDNNGSSDVPYIWKNGVWTGNTDSRNNQYGINSETFRLRVSGNGQVRTITTDVSEFVPNGKTRQDFDLNYDVAIFSGELFDFGIEKTITITGEVYDRKGNRSSLFTRVFNQPKGPTLIPDSANPKGGDQYRNLKDPVVLGIQDDWAGVSGSSIIITLSGVNGTDYGPYVFSGSDLNLSGVGGIALTADYIITISNHEEFPVSGTINVSVYALDNEGNEDTISDYQFTTRPSCTELQCCDPLEIRIASGDDYKKIIYTGGDILKIAGSESTTGFVAGDTGYLDCNSSIGGLDVYVRGEYKGFIEDSVLDLLGTGVKGVISGNELILSLLIDTVSVILDSPSSGQNLDTGNVDFVWHLTGSEDVSRISGYIIEIFSGDESFIDSGFTSQTGRNKDNLSDGSYLWRVTPVDALGNLGESSDLSPFFVDATAPTFDFENNIGYECETGYLHITNVVDYSQISGYKFNDGEWSFNSGFVIYSDTTGKEYVTGYVQDILGNIGGKVSWYEFLDTGVSASDFTISGVLGSGIVNWINLSDAKEGACGDTHIWGVVISSGNNGHCSISGYELTYIANVNFIGEDSCTIRVHDDDGQQKDITVSITNIQGLSRLTGWVQYSPEHNLLQSSGWTSGDVVATLMLNGTGIILDKNGNEIPSSYTFTGNGEFTFVFSGVRNTGEVIASVSWIDKNPPTFDFESKTGYECETGYLVMTNIADTGSQFGDSPYKFDGDWGQNTGYEIYSGLVGSVVITGYVRDLVGWITEHDATFEFINADVTANDISVIAGTGITINWMDLSNVTEGNCGVVNLTGELIATGTKGSCELTGQNTLIYVPSDSSVSGEDTCVILVTDDEGSTGEIVINLVGINQEAKVILKTPENDAVLNPGNVDFTWSVDNPISGLVISGFVYKIGDKTGFVQTTGVTLNMTDGNYTWSVYAVFDGGMTGGQSSEFKLKIACSNCGGGGGGGGGLTKDKCPDGDFSDSYYDGECGQGYHGSADDYCGVKSSDYSEELIIGYLYSYGYGITTMCPIRDAMLDGYLYRDHFAKMISEYAVKVVGKVPNYGKEGCDSFNDIDDDTDELKYFMKTACELNLMGLHSDGDTPKDGFDPHQIVTRAEFGTVFSRLLFGDMYNVEDASKIYKEPGYWYKKHLQALKDYGIMTKVDGSWPQYLERRGRVMLMLWRADKYGVFAGKSPARNGIEALFY